MIRTVSTAPAKSQGTETSLSYKREDSEGSGESRQETEDRQRSSVVKLYDTFEEEVRQCREEMRQKQLLVDGQLKDMVKLREEMWHQQEDVRQLKATFKEESDRITRQLHEIIHRLKSQ